MNRFNQIWTRLIAAARRAPATRDSAVPYGFATRVAALAGAAARPAGALWERISWRAFGVAFLLMVACVVANYSAIASALNEDPGIEDPVAEVLAATATS